jgi:hypothetical protein
MQTISTTHGPTRLSRHGRRSIPRRPLTVNRLTLSVGTVNPRENTSAAPNALDAILCDPREFFAGEQTMLANPSRVTRSVRILRFCFDSASRRH